MLHLITTSLSILATRRVCAALLSLCFFGHAAAVGADARETKEYQIKAAFVLNFAKFLEWPEGRFADAEQPIAIGVIGDTPLAAELQSIVKDRKVRGRSILVQTARTAEDIRRMHLLFVGADKGAEFSEIKSEAHHAAVLTVGESPDFAAAGGIITFAIEGDKVRFAINIDSAERAHLKISAQLQQLATSVRRTP